ncbi:MAG: fasciclin domain-containing protein [Verrucomicrobiota bacterium]
MKTKHLTHTALFLCIAALNPLVSAQDAPVEKPVILEKATVQPGTLTTVIADSVTFSTLTSALKAAELDITLGGKDEYTIFAPTDEAFAKLPPETLTKLLLPENKEKLRMLLLYHVIAGKVVSGELIDGDVKTVNGEKVSVDVSDDKVEINGEKVFTANVPATNGVMHSIGVVLVPKSLDGFVGLDK